jgi:hypothetical protein
MGPWCFGARKMLEPTLSFYQKLNFDITPGFWVLAKMLHICGSFVLCGLIAIIHDY